MPFHQWLLRLTVLALIMLGTGCGKNEEIIRVEEEPFPEPVELIKASISGALQTTDGLPLENAQIEIYESLTSTDENGYFHLSDELMPKMGTLIEVRKEGFFNGYSLIQVPNSGRRFQPVHLSPRENIFQFDNSDGFTWTSPEGLELSILPMGVIRPDGTPAAGLVSVSVRWISPEGPSVDFSNLQIIRGFHESQGEVAIRHVGMLQMEIRDLAGNSLELASARLDIPIDQIQGSQPRIPDLELWQIDRYGFWRQADSLHLDGQNLNAHLTGSALWSIGTAGPIQKVDGQFFYKNPKGVTNPLPFQSFRLLAQKGISQPFDVISDDEGRYTLYLPSDNAYQVQVPDECGQIFSVTSPPDWVAPSSLNLIEISNDSLPAWTKKRFIDCEGAPILEGYLCIKSGQIKEQIIPLQPSDSGRVYLPVCQPENVSYDLYDQQGMNRWAPPSPYPFIRSEQEVISLCDSMVIFFDLTLEGTKYTFSQCQAFLVKEAKDPEKRVIHLVAFDAPFSSRSDFIDLWITGDSPGVLGIQSITFRIKSFQNNIIEGTEAQVKDVRATIDRVGVIDGGISGSIRGNMLAGSTGAIELTAQFNALRLN